MAINMNITKKTKILYNCKPDSIPEAVFSSHCPIILKGLTANWPLTQISKESTKKFIEYLKSQYNGREATAFFTNTESSGRISYNDEIKGFNFEIKQAKINDVLDEIWSLRDKKTSSLRYIASNSVDLSFPQLRKENDISFNSDYFKQNPIDQLDPIVGIWIGNKATAPCHYDALNNIACCVAGKRKFTLFPPDQIANLYPGPLDPTPGGQAITMVDFANPDFEKYPKFRDAIKSAEVAELETGDALFIPSMWWHQVDSLSNFNTLINYWWGTVPRINGQGMTVLQHAFLSLRDRSIEEKQAWKHIFDYYIFDNLDKANAHIPEHARGILSELDERKARQLRSLLINKLNR